MKRVINLLLLCLFCTAMQAQEVSLTIDIEAGGLKDALTKKQKDTVTSLTLTGSMNDSDFYLIRDSMPELKALDMKYVEVDTIPVKAFYSSKCENFVLPFYLKYICRQAFSYPDNVMITGEFPNLDVEVFMLDGDSNFRGFFGISNDNPYCKVVDGNIYSKDGKIFYYSSCHDSNSIEEDTEIIESRAFDGSGLSRVYFPSSLKLIKKFAFSNIQALIPACYVGCPPLIFKSQTPPVLEPNAFDGEKIFWFAIWVPIGSADIYKQSDPQWSTFGGGIQEDDDGSSIRTNSLQSLYVEKDGNGIRIIADKDMANISIVNLSGVSCYNQALDDMSFDIPKLFVSGVYLLKVIFKDGTMTSLKLIK